MQTIIARPVPNTNQNAPVVTRIKRVNGYVGHHYEAYFGDDFFVPFEPWQIEAGTDHWIEDCLPEDASDDEITAYWNAFALSVNPNDPDCSEWNVRPSVLAMIAAEDALYPKAKLKTPEEIAADLDRRRALLDAATSPIQGPMPWISSPEDFKEFMESWYLLEPEFVHEPWYTRLGGQYEAEPPRKAEPKGYTAPAGTWHNPELISAIGAWCISKRGQFTDAERDEEIKNLLPNMEDQSPSKQREYRREATRAASDFRSKDKATAEKAAAHTVRLTEAFRRAKTLAAAGTPAEEIEAILIAEFKDVSPDERQNMVANSGLRVEPTDQDVSAFEQGIRNARIVRTAPAGATQAQIINALLKGSWSL